MTSEHTVNRVSSEQFEIVDQLLKRQDELLEQLEDLDSRVESAITQFLPPKPVEIESVGTLESIELPSISDENGSDLDQSHAGDVRKAA